MSRETDAGLTDHSFDRDYGPFCDLLSLISCVMICKDDGTFAPGRSTPFTAKLTRYCSVAVHARLMLQFGIPSSPKHRTRTSRLSPSPRMSF